MQRKFEFGDPANQELNKKNLSQGKTYLKTLVPKSKTSTNVAYNLRFMTTRRKETERNAQYSPLYSGICPVHIILKISGK